MKTIKIKLSLLGLVLCVTVFTKINANTSQYLDTLKTDSIRMAYPFQLKDRHGNIVKMEDFRGKVVVMDFWYTRCVPCMVMAKPLAEMREYYKDNPHVVFIDVNLDKDVDKWKNSLANGSKLGKETLLYTDSLSISLSTAPVGFFNEMTSYYNIKGVPAWIIIGAKGEILERNPPRPLPKSDGVESPGSLRFKALINEYLWSYLKLSRVR
ncbi:TlpA family protein disulfide reductase [Sphingobacterium thalpophilum]|uniref:TlpA family protein disulfide reductase n=1 Tax=Sphingobacterium thalpophilum TaxID=259 RepID=UPI0037DA0E85